MTRTRRVTPSQGASASASSSSALSTSCPVAPAASSAPSPIAMAHAVARRLSRSTVLVVVLAAVLATLLPDHVLQPAHAQAPSTVVSCPYGWSLYTPPSSSSTDEVSTCVRVITAAPVSAAAAETACQTIFTQPGTPPPLSADGVTPWPYARSAAPQGVAVRSTAANAFVRGLFADTDAAAAAGAGSDASAGGVVLGGKAGYGAVRWNDDAVAGASYTNFADDVDWQLHSGTIAMRASGLWMLITTTQSTHPYACAFSATFDVTTTPQPDGSHASSSATHAASSSGGGGSHGESGSGEGPRPGSRRAHRPAVPQPAPACLPGWTALPTGVDTSEGAANTVCYRLVANTSEVGGRLGKTFEAARSYCAAVHPKATLASVMSREENAWIASSLLAPLTVTTPPTITSTGACVCDSAAAAAPPASTGNDVTARTVFLGGSYMRDGSGGGLIGSWYADQYLFNASDFTAASPSSPAWPTSSNLYFANWGRGEPALAYGVVGMTPPTVCGCNTSTSATATSGGGAWVGLDPRSTQPFLCSYLNDGSVFPAPPPTTTPIPSPTPAPTPSPSELCIAGWSYLAQTNSCYRVYPAADPSRGDSDPVTAATMEETCEGVLRGRVVASKINRVHAVAILSVAESNYVGSLFQLYLGNPFSSGGSSAAVVGGAGAAPLPVSLAGASFVDDGASGFYISGARVLDPVLAETLWAAGEPANVKGCTAVDGDGLWYYVPCSSSTSDSIPPNNAVQVVAYTCQYAAPDIDPTADLLPEPTTTQQPQPTSGPDWSSDSGSSDDGVPLGNRVGSLSGAVHLVVAPGSTGIYTLEAPSRGGSGGILPAPSASVRGLHLYFAPLPVYYSYPVPAHGVDGTTLVPPALTTPATTVNDLLSIGADGDFTGGSAGRAFAPCDGYKDQARIARVRSGTVTVRHSNVSEVGYVCVSRDGRTYVPTTITYEVTEVTVAGFVPAPSRSPQQQQQQQQAATSASSAWLPPLFCGSTTPSTPSGSCTVQSVLAIGAHATGTVQLALRHSGASGTPAADGSFVTTTLSPERDTTVSHLRLSSAANCMDPQVPFQLLASEVAVQHVASARYTQPAAPLPPHTDNATQWYSVVSYQYAAVHAAHLTALSPVYNSSAEASVLARSQPPSEYYVCIAVEKTAAPSANRTDVTETAAASRRLLALWGPSAVWMPSITGPAAAAAAVGALSENSTRASDAASSFFSSSSPSSSASAAARALILTIAERLAARTSLSPSGAPVRLYTAVPGLKAHFVPPPVSVKGMWALPPRRLGQYTTTWASTATSADAAVAQPRVSLVPAAATHNRTAHYLLRTRDAFDPANPSASTVATSGSSNASVMTTASTVHLHVPQYSAPIVLLDSHDVRPGMLALLSQDPSSCNRYQPVPHADPTAAAAAWPPYVDTMVPLSTVAMYVDEGDGDGAAGSPAAQKTSTMAYLQLNLNHTGLWGHHPTRTDDAAAMQQTWYVCIAYSAMSPFLPLRYPQLAITVHRLQVSRFVMDASAAFTSSDAVAASEAADASTTHLNVNTGFAGMLWLHGVDVRLWSTTTLHSAQVAFSVALPSSGAADDTAAQCSNANLFYAQRGLGLLTPDNRRVTRVTGSANATTPDADTAARAAGFEARVGMVVPLGFFRQQSMRRMQLCLSVPLPFAPTTASAQSSSGSSSGTSAAAALAMADLVPQRRYFAPLVNTTLDVRPIELLYVGRYSAIPASAPAVTATPTTSATVIRVAEGARDIVLPLTGYGIRPDMTMFLSPTQCAGVPASGSNNDDGVDAAGSGLVDRQSVLNISVVSLYDLPSSYWAVAAADSSSSAVDDDEGRTHQPRVFVVLKHTDLLSRTAANHLFGPSTSAAATVLQRTPMHVCLYAPGTARLVFPTDFQLVVDPPRVTSIRNLPSDAPLLARALAHMPTSNSSSGGSAISNGTATVVYASTMDLVVEGFGLDDNNTWLMPAVDCGNTSSFLWRAPVQLSALPSSTTTTVHMEVAASGGTRHPLYAESTRYVDPQTSYSSWFLSLRQGETARIGAAVNVSSGTHVTRFQWCVRVVEEKGDNATASPFAATGLPYQLLIPVADGFVLEGTRNRRAVLSSVLALPTQDPEKGRWFPLQLAGPIVDVAQLVGSPLYLFLAPQAFTCAAVKNSYLMHGLYTFGNNSFSAVNGTGVLLPRWLSAPGVYQLCASTLYPTMASADEGVEAALQFFTMGALRVQLTKAVYAVFALNHTTTVTVEQGQEWTLPISGSLLTNRSLVRFQPTAAQCAQPMLASASGAVAAVMGTELPDIRVEDDFADFPLFGQSDYDDDAGDNSAGFLTNSHYVVLSQSLIRALAAPATYVLCFQPQTHLEWRAAPAVTLVVHTHVRRPTSYSYFPDDGSEDVALLTALAPTKVALEWNTAEEHTVNVVGAAERQVSLALWCRPRPSPPNQSSSSGHVSSSVVEVEEEELVPCGNHRRVMFVKPLDSDEDPCFVDAEAIADDVQRGPYVLDFGVLTLPFDLSVPPESAARPATPVSTMIPNMTQPWIMCLETGPERWREPIFPMFQLQYTNAIATGFRVTIDDVSNTSAPFPAHKTSVEATTSAEVDEATAMPLGGNTTLFLYAQDSSQVVFLNGYGIERGHWMRFGAHCEEAMAPPSPSSGQAGGGSGATTTDAAYAARVALVQGIVNTRLYTDPLPIEDDNGVFLVPSTHIEAPEESASAPGHLIPACLSTDNGVTYQRTTLALRVLPSRLRVDTATTQRNLLAQLLTNTLLVPQHSRGSVDLTQLLSNAAAASSAAAPKPSSHGFLPTGTQVLLSTSCGVNSHGIPIITIATPDVLALTALQTSATTTQRLRMCVRSADAAAAAAAAAAATAGHGNAGGSDTDGSANTDGGASTVSENDAGAPTMYFTASGVYYRVMAVRVDRVSLHAWTPSAAMQADLIDHVVLRRGALEDLLLSVLLESCVNASSSGSSTTTTIASGNDVMTQEDELLQRLELSPSALSLLSLTRFYVGRPCFRSEAAAAAATQPSSAVSPYVSSYAGMQLTFSADRVTASPLPLTGLAPAADSLNKTLVAALPSTSGGDVLNDVPHFSLEERGSICFSVDGGLHYLSVGIAHFTEDWAPTLRVTLDTEDNENDEDVAEEDSHDDAAGASAAAVTTTSALRVYAQSSTTRRLYDTRFVDPSTVPEVGNAAAGASEMDAQLRVLADVGQLTTALLWNGFLGSDGFAMDGLLYLPASGVRSEPNPVAEPLRFSLDNRLQNLSTNMTVTVVPWSLVCYAAAGQDSMHVRRQDTGVLAATTPGVCSAGVRDGVRVRVVPLQAAACTDTAAVEASYLFDLPTVQPAAWGAAKATTTAQPSSSSSSTSTPARAMQLPMGLRYVPDGVYALCLRQDRPFTSTLAPQRDAGSTSNDLFTVAYAPTPLRLRVAHGFAIESVSGASTGSGSGDGEDALVAIPQSANAVLSVSGTAVGVRDVPLLFAFAPMSPQTGAAWSWSGGCAAVPEAWDPVTGTSVVASAAADSQDGLLLATPWYNAHDGVLRVPAAYTRRVEWGTSNTTTPATALPGDDNVSVAMAGPYYTVPLRPYALCYSVDGGLTFRAAAGESAAVPGLAVVVVPPSITSLSSSRTSSVEASAERLQWSAQEATATSVRVQHLYTTAAADAALNASVTGGGGVPEVAKFMRLAGSGAAAMPYASRPPTYTYAWTSAFVGNGIGAASGRRLPDAAAAASGAGTVAADVPTIVAAVALVRSSRYGGRCDGATPVAASFTDMDETATGSAAWGSSTSVSPANATSPLAAPVFLLSLQHGGVWASTDAAAAATWQASQSAARIAEFARMNPVLTQASWVAQTEALWTLYASATPDNASSSSSSTSSGHSAYGSSGAAPINGQSILGWATSAAVAAARSNGQSIVPCLSLDGAHFFTADVARAAAAAAVRPNGTSMAATPEAQQFFVIAAARGGASGSGSNGSTETVTTAPVSRMSPWPLYLRAAVPPNVSSNGTDITVAMPLLWMREAAMVMEVLARPTAALAGQPMRGHTAASLARFQAAVAAALGVDAAVVVAQLYLSGYTDAPAITAAPTADADLSGQPLRTYALILTVTADAVAYNATTQLSTLSPAPELLYRGVQLLRSNTTGPALLATLMVDNMNTSTSSNSTSNSGSAPAVAAAGAAVVVSSLTVNFTLRNGADLHAVNASMPAMLPTAPPQEVAWRRLFLDIPYATLVPGPVPDADDNDTTPKVKWWAIPLLLVLPAAMLYGTYYVYKKYLRRPPEVAVVIENA